MITNLMITGEHKITADKNGKLSIGENNVSVKEIPFVRYRLNEYSENTMDYIVKCKELFRYSCHILELDVSDDAIKIVQMLEESDMEDVIIFMYIGVTDEELYKGIGNDVLNKANEILAIRQCERILVKDNTTEMHMVEFNKLREQLVTALNISDDTIGICGSPLSIYDNCCLSAVRARELMALYGESDECALPSSKHESMNTCGCIRHLVIDSDIQCFNMTKSANIKQTLKDTSNKSRNKKMMKKFKP